MSRSEKQNADSDDRVLFGAKGEREPATGKQGSARAIFIRWRFIYREFIRFSCTSGRPAADTAVEKVSTKVDVDTICNTWLIREGIHGDEEICEHRKFNREKKKKKTRGRKRNKLANLRNTSLESRNFHEIRILCKHWI